MRSGDGGQRARRHPQQRRPPHHTVHRGVCGRQRAQGGRPRQASGYHQPHQDHLLHQAFHGRDLRPRDQRGEPRALYRGTLLQQHAESEDRRPLLHRAGDLRYDSAKDEENGGGLPRSGGDGSRHHGACLLQRLSASGHQGGRRDCGSERETYHQRAYRSRSGLRSGQEESRLQSGRVRPRRRYLRYLHPRVGRRCLRGEIHQRRHAPRRRRLRPQDHRLVGRRVHEGLQRRSA